MKVKNLMITFVGLASVACSSDNGEKKALPVKVKTEVVTPSECGGVRNYVGEVEALESTSVSFTGMGTLVRVAVEEGQMVRKGQLIAQMDAAQARNTLATCEAQMRQADDAYARMKTLHDANSISDMKWVEIESKVAQAKAQVEMARKALDDCNLYAPVSGYVGKKVMSAGETAMPSMTVCTILNIDDVKVRISVPEKDIASVTPDSRSHISVGAMDRTVEGGRIEKGVEADAITRSYPVRIFVENCSHALLPGMVADVTLVHDKGACASSSIMLPVTSVQSRNDGGKFVWTVRDGVAKRTDVKVGRASGNRIAVTEGLKQGDRVITKGYQKVSEGSEVVY